MAHPAQGPELGKTALSASATVQTTTTMAAGSLFVCIASQGSGGDEPGDFVALDTNFTVSAVRYGLVGSVRIRSAPRALGVPH